MALDPNRYKPYDREYAKHDNAKQRARMKARYAMVKRYGEAALRGKDIDHKKPLQAGGSNDPSNWRIQSSHENRSRANEVKKDPDYKPIHLGRIK
jgi:hypothetical protein